MPDAVPRWDLLALVLVLNAGMNAWKMGLGSWLLKALGWAAGFAVEWVLLWAVLNVLVYNFLPLGLVPVEEDPAYQGVTRIVEYFASHPEERARFAKEYGAFVRELDRLVSRGQLTADKAAALISRHPEAYRAAAELAKIAWRPGLPALGAFVRDVVRGRVKGVAAVSTFAALVLSSVEKAQVGSCWPVGPRPGGASGRGSRVEAGALGPRDGLARGCVCPGGELAPGGSACAGAGCVSRVPVSGRGVAARTGAGGDWPGPGGVGLRAAGGCTVWRLTRRQGLG